MILRLYIHVDLVSCSICMAICLSVTVFSQSQLLHLLHFINSFLMKTWWQNTEITIFYQIVTWSKPQAPDSHNKNNLKYPISSDETIIADDQLSIALKPPMLLIDFKITVADIVNQKKKTSGIWSVFDSDFIICISKTKWR